MNKLFNKIAALSVGLAMAIGVGVAVGSGKGAVKVEAADSTYTLGTIPTKGWSTSGGSQTMNSISWTYDSTTSISGANNKIQVGSKNNPQTTAWHIKTAISNFGTGKVVKSVTLSAYTTAESATYDITVGSSSVKSGSLTTSTANYTASNLNASSGYVDFTLQGSSDSKAMYITGISITYGDSASTKTLSNIALSGTYPTAFTTGDTFSHSGMTVTANYSDSSSADVTSSATFTGYDMSSSGNQTVTVSYSDTYGSASTTYSITVSAPATPTISLDESSFTGYTGQNFSVTATYSNLTSAFGWSTSGTGTTSESITSTGTNTDGTSTYSGTLTGEGTKTLTAAGGGATSQTYTISITQTTVDITKSSTSIPLGLSETLAVSHNASSAGGLTWESSNAKVSVNSAGKVTVANDATVGSTVTITATSQVDTSVYDTCTVTVDEAPPQDVLDSSVIPDEAVGSGTTAWGTASTFSDSTGAVYTARFMGVSSSSFIGRLNDSTNGYIYTSTVPTNMKLVSVSIESMTASKTVGVYAQSGAYTAAPSDKSTALGTITPSSLTYTFDENTEYDAICLRGHTSATEIGTVTITYAKGKTLSSITLSGTYQSSFTIGDTFNHTGMVVTANYSDSTSATVTSSATWTSPDMSTTGAKTVTVSYEDDYGSASKTYSITVSYAAPTSITLSSSSAAVALEEAFDLSDVSVTINPSATADQTAYAWSLYDDGDLVENTDYVWISPEIMSYKAGTFVFRCISTEDGTKYAEFTLTVSGDPIAHLKDDGDHDVTGGSTTVFADAGVLSYSVATENFQGTLTYTWLSSNSSAISVKEDADDMCDYQVNTAGSARLSCRVQGSTKGDVTVYIDVTVTAVTVTSVSWTAPTIDVFSGATLSSTSGWNVKYSTNSGKTDLTPDSFNVKLGGSTISLPYTWKASDNEKTLCVEVGGASSSTTTVTVTQTINNVNAPNMDTNTVSWTASAAADLGSQISSQGETDEGTISTGDYSWNYTRTLVSLASGKSDFISFQGSTWIQLGSGNALESIEFTTSAIPGTIKSVSVVAATAGTHALTIDVGGTKYLEDESLQTYSGTAAAANPDPDNCAKTGTGSSSGAITITIAQSGSTKKALVIRSISVTYETPGSSTSNIANDASHKAAQRVAVKFAKAFNAAMDTTSNCTTNLSTAWATCSSAYDTFKSEAAALGSAEEAYAKNLIKYATAQYSDDSGEACIERMMKTYEICVSKHGQTAFMSELVTVGAYISPIQQLVNSGNTKSIAIVVIISTISVAAIGGYFFLRRRKED